ncbi:hypothetical protein L7F22_063428 [Adiantum nelumboides]|nr:hypothetical protein [Adiantum nelumboides]
MFSRALPEAVYRLDLASTGVTHDHKRTIGAESMSNLSQSSSRDSRRSRGSTKSRISRYSDEELLKGIQRRGLHSTGESARADSDRQSSRSQSRYHTPRHTPQRPPKYPTSRWSPLVGASQATTPLETPRVSSYTPLETLIALETPNFTPVAGTPTRHGWSPEETPPETPTFSKTYYDIDDDGCIIADSRGNLIISDLKGLIDVYMLRHMFTNWKKMPYEDKQVIHGILHERFPNPHGNIKEAVDRYPTQQEVMRGRAIGLSALLEELAASGTQVKNVDVLQVVNEIVFMRALMQLRPKLAKLLSIIYDLMQADYTYNESIDAVTNMGPPLFSQTGEYPDFVERTPDNEDEDEKDYLPTDEEECEEMSESKE